MHSNWCTADKLNKVCVSLQEQDIEDNDSSGKSSECDDKLTGNLHKVTDQQLSLKLKLVSYLRNAASLKSRV